MKISNGMIGYYVNTGSFAAMMLWLGGLIGMLLVKYGFADNIDTAVVAMLVLTLAGLTVYTLTRKMAAEFEASA